jgi:predicted metal-dependent HD superfamily phosphohydrolase
MQADLARPAFITLEALYQHPPRVYHTLEHVASCLAIFDEQRQLAKEPKLVEFALWLHDCVYRPATASNEEHSAAIAAMMLAGLGIPDLGRHRVRDMILATRHGAQATTPDAQLVADVDLAILGSSREQHAAYVRGIRAEYAAFDDATWSRGRRAFVQKLLEKPALFITPELAARFEAPARTNLARELNG